MNKQTRFLLALLISLPGLAAFGQGQHIVLNQPITGGQHTYTATESIRMVPGFSYKPVAAGDFFVGEIGEHLIIPPTDGIYGGHPDNDMGGVVGSLAGNLMVSPTGAAVYNIPIELPPGVGGMVPKLAISYNSQGGNGPLGLGWGLSGLSSITRTGQTLYHDGKVEGITFNGDDRYVIDGQRLISVGTHEYRTEVEGFSKITSHGSAGDGPEWFKVQTKAGQTLYYGSEPNGRVEATGRPSILTWHLCKIEDFMGNVVEFDYHKAGGTGRVTSIKYGGNSNTGQGHMNEVAFSYYDSRPDEVRSYVAGSYIDMNYLLEDISVYGNNQLTHTYSLDYESDFISRLQRVWLLDGVSKDNHLNPIDFEWGADGEHKYERKIVDKETNNWYVDHYFLDINDNGLSDVIRIEYELYQEENHIAKKAVNWYYRFNLGDGQFGPRQSFNADPPFQFYKNLMVGDINGDGLDDFLEVRHDHEDITKRTYIVSRIFYSNGNGFTSHVLPGITGHAANLPEFRFGDFDGNGKLELMAAYKKKSPSEDNVFIWRFSESWEYAYVVFWDQLDFGNKDHELSEFIVADFTGDGRSDVLRTAKYHATPDESNGFIYSVDLERRGFSFVYGGLYPNVGHRVFQGDFNGDGITDILTYNYSASNPQWKIGYFKGNNSGFVETNIADLNSGLHFLHHFSPFEPNLDRNHAIVISDFNGDGKHDIMQLAMSGDELYKACCDIYYSNGERFEKKSHTFTGIDGFATVSSSLRNHTFPYIDLNGDGKSDLFLLGVQSIDYEYLLDIDNDLKFLNSFTNGLGNKSKFLYNPLTNQDIYSKGSPENFPLQVIQPPLYVVTSVFQDINSKHTEIKTYEYQGALYHKHGKGFLGFRKITDLNKLSGILSENTSSLFIDNGKYFYPYISEIKTYKSESQWITHGIFQYDVTVNNMNSLVFFPYLKSEFHLEIDYEQTSLVKSAKVTYGFDGFGNRLFRQVLTHPSITGPNSPPSFFDHQNTETTLFLLPNPSNISRPDIITETSRYKTNPSIVTKKKHKYHGSSPLVREIELWPGGNSSDPLMTRKAFTYDAVGNVKTTTLSAPNYSPAIDPRIATIEYSADFRFPEHQHDQTGYTISTQFDPVYGWKNTSTNTNNVANGLDPVSYTHHPLGIYSSVTFPDNNMQLNVLRWAQKHPHAPDEALYYSWGQASGQAEILVFYNKTGQELRSATKSFDGSWVYVDKLYDERSLLWKESMPYFANESPLYTVYSYDKIGRIENIKYPDAATTTKTYQANTITTTNRGGQTSTQAYNAAGWLIESTDAEGTKVNYDYFSDGKLKTTHIVGQSQTTVSLDYNSRRQRTSLNDPNYGLATYTYNPFDELVAQLSPKGQTTSYSYDLVGRMESMTAPEGQTQWVFDRAPGRLGTLQSVQGPGHRTAYSYDDHLRPETVTETINGTNYQTHYTYDAFGREETATHPSGFGTRNEYNPRGYLKRIRKLDNSLLWQTDHTNALGQLTEYQTGNGLATTKKYEEVTKRLSSIKTLKTGQDPVQDLGYTWYEVGNLEERTCKKHNLNELFTYDDLNRLETISLNGTIRGEHHYDPAGLGNIVYKKADGQVLFDNAAYGENTAGPHALTSAETAPGVFPEDAQSIIYNSFDKVTGIYEGRPPAYKELTIQYGHHRERISQQYSDGQNTIDKVWAGSCEYITENGQTTTLTYLSGPEGVFALHVKNPNGSENIRYIHKDHLGSWNTITDENGNLLQELSFDAWGNRRNPATWRAFTGAPPPPMFDRGFTGHEHLYGFQLINMNGRMYDPVVSRMLSPDNFIQAPDFSQSFNRYSYVWNNPLVLTDPDGEIVMYYALGLFITGSIIENAINHNDYGHKSVGDVIRGGYKQGMNAYNEIQSITSFTVYQNENFSLSLGLNMTGLGLNINMGYRAGNFNFGVGGGINSVVNPEVSAQTGSNNFELVPQVAGGIGYADDNFSFTYYQTYYGGLHKQRVGGVNFSTGEFSLRWENDFFAQSGDKWRSNAMEFDIKGFVFGYSTYNNDPEGQRQRSFNGASPTWGVNKSKYDAWEDGRTYLSPFWIGIRNGNNIAKLGYSHDLVQDLTQNFMHQQSIFKPGNQHYYLNYDYNYKGIWGYSGYYNPFSLY